MSHMYTISLPGAPELCSRLVACVIWLMIHPNHHHNGKPMQFWSKEIYEPHMMNKFILASCIPSHVIVSFKIDHRHLCIAIPVVLMFLYYIGFVVYNDFLMNSTCRKHEEAFRNHDIFNVQEMFKKMSDFKKGN